MRHDHHFQRTTRRRGRYAPAHAWLGSPGDGPTIRPQTRPKLRWRFGWTQARVLLLAILLGTLAWPQLLKIEAVSTVAGTHRSR